MTGVPASLPARLALVKLCPWLAAVLVCTTLSAPALAQDIEDEARADDPGMIERVFPLTVEDGLHPAADASYSLFFLGALLPLGSMWLPPLFGEADTPLGYFAEAPLILGAHVAPHLAMLTLLPCSLVVAPFLGGPVLVVAGLLLQFVNLGCCIANAGYFVPVALLNAYNRGLRADEAELSADSPADPGALRY